MNFLKYLYLAAIILITCSVSAQPLSNIQRGPAPKHIVVSDGTFNTLVYRDAISYIRDTLGYTDSIYISNDTIFLRDGSGYVYKKTTLEPYIVGPDTTGVLVITRIMDIIDTTLIEINQCAQYADYVGTTLNDVVEYINQTTQDIGSSAFTNNVGINTLTPIYTLDVVGVDGIRVPAGTTAQRPASPQAGVIRFNTTTGRFEGYNGTVWRNLSLP